MGLQIALVGLTSINLVVPDERTIVALGPIFEDYTVTMSLLGLVLIGTLLHHRVKGAILIGIALTSVASWSCTKSFPKSYLKFPNLFSLMPVPIAFQSLDIIKLIPAISAFLFIGIFDISGVVFGMSSIARLTTSGGDIPGSVFAFFGCGVGSVVDAAIGSAPLIVYVESAAGIREGGRTGLTAITVGVLFLLSIFFAPLFSLIPSAAATASVSILIGVKMMGQAVEIDWDSIHNAIPAFITVVIMPFTFSITNGIMLGLLTSLLFQITTGQYFSILWQQLNALHGNHIETVPLLPQAAFDENDEGMPNFFYKEAVSGEFQV